MIFFSDSLCTFLYSLRDCLAFCTEPVFASLSNVLGQWDNLPSPVPTDIKEYKLYDVETKYGLLQVRVQTVVGGWSVKASNIRCL